MNLCKTCRRVAARLIVGLCLACAVAAGHHEPHSPDRAPGADWLRIPPVAGLATSTGMLFSPPPTTTSSGGPKSRSTST